MTKFKMGVTALALVAASTAAYAAGLWPNLPIVGSAAYCGGYSTGTSGQVCSVNVPAGPTALSGAETYPADTNLSGGVQPQTVRIPAAVAASGAYGYVAPLTGTTNVIPNNVNTYLINPAGTLAALTLTMPSSPVDGQVLRIASSKSLTSLTINGAAGQTVSNAPTAMTISTTGGYGYSFIYRSTGETWYRLN